MPLGPRNKMKLVRGEMSEWVSDGTFLVLFRRINCAQAQFGLRSYADIRPPWLHPVIILSKFMMRARPTIRDLDVQNTRALGMDELGESALYQVPQINTKFILIVITCRWPHGHIVRIRYESEQNIIYASDTHTRKFCNNICVADEISSWVLSSDKTNTRMHSTIHVLALRQIELRTMGQSHGTAQSKLMRRHLSKSTFNASPCDEPYGLSYKMAECDVFASASEPDKFGFHIFRPKLLWTQSSCLFIELFIKYIYILRLAKDSTEVSSDHNNNSPEKNSINIEIAHAINGSTKNIKNGSISLIYRTLLTFRSNTYDWIKWHRT